jgi:methyl-accepting chemotaxis protein
MDTDRIEGALKRIESAMERIATARETAAAQGQLTGGPAGGSARVVELVNTHEKLREQVAESLREIDDLIGKLEE